MLPVDVHIDSGVTIARWVQIWHNSVIRTGVVLGDRVTIGHLVVVERDTTIGHDTTIQSQCHITALAEIGCHCFFGPGVIMTNEVNIAASGRAEQKLEKTIIGSGVRIGAGSIILPGITIGDDAFIAIGSLINKDVPPGEFWAGRPARRVRSIPASERLYTKVEAQSND